MLPPEPPTAELARVLAAEAQILMLRAPGDVPRAACEHAIEVARAVGAQATEGHATNSLGVIKMGAGDFEGSERALREAMRIAEEVTDLDGIWRAYTNLSECLDEQGRVDEAATLALEGADQSRPPRHALLRAVPAGRGVLAAHAPRPPRRDGRDPRARAGRGAQGRRRGRPARQRRPPRHAPRAASTRRSSTSSRRASCSGARATRCGSATRPPGARRRRCGPADPERAWQLATGALDFVPEDQYAHFTTRLHATALRAAADRAQRALALGDHDAAAEAQRDARATFASLRALLAPERWHGGAPGPEPAAFDALGAAELARAEGQPDPAAWDAAAERFAALEEPFERGYARWRQAEALVAAGADRAAAAGALREAAEVAAEPARAAADGRGRGPGHARARVALDAAPDRGPEDGGVDRLGLTERELTVLELVAEGHTNREIGETLFISEKTASVHVSRILAKLGVRSRVEAATAAHRLGLTAASAPGDGGRG